MDNADPDLPPVAPEQAVERLEAAVGPLDCFTYTSHSDRPERRKFRVVARTSRDISREEARALFVLLDAAAFGQQGDAAIYDPGDFLFALPFHTETIERDGAPLDVDAILAEVPGREAEPDLWRKFAPKEARREARTATPEEASRLRAAMRRHEVRQGFCGIDDPAVFNPERAGL